MLEVAVFSLKGEAYLNNTCAKRIHLSFVSRKSRLRMFRKET